jgi:D-alanyl-D-alanine carboxypeptidase/D-alanyl-D-alanine-endopeptidase (penicillin-binding protein 4)
VLQARLATSLAQRSRLDPRHAAFLRTGVRSERDPALRAFLAETLYRTDPRDSNSVRLFLDAAQATEDTFGRLARVARALQLEVPLVGSLVELASAGSLEATGRLFELARAAAADAPLYALLAERLASVAADAPVELIQALRAQPEAVRGEAEDALVAGLLRQARPDSPFWAALREVQGALDPGLAEYGKALEATLARKVAAARAPVPVVEAPPPASAPAAGGVSAPGG